MLRRLSGNATARITSYFAQMNPDRECIEKTPPISRGFNIFDSAEPQPRDASEVLIPAHLIPDFMARKAFLSFFEDRGLYPHLLESMDDLYTKLVPYMIMEFGTIIVVSERTQSVHVLYFRPPKEIRRPQKRERLGYVSDLTPNEAQDRGLTYEASIILDVVHDVWRVRDGKAPIQIPRKNSSTTPATQQQQPPPALAVLRPAPCLEEKNIYDIVSPIITPWRQPERESEDNDSIFGQDEGIPAPQGTLRENAPSDPRPGRDSRCLRPEDIVSPTGLKTLDQWASSTVASQMDIEIDTDRFEHVSRTVCESTKHFNLPVMVGSRACHTRHRPPGSGAPWNRSEGYFIINGQEKAVIPQLVPCANTMIVHTPVIRQHIQKTTGEMRPRHPAKIRSTSTIYVLIQSGPRGTGVVHAYVKLPYIKRKIPLLAFARLIGWKDVRGIARVIALQGKVHERDAERIPYRPETARFEHWICDMLRTRARGDPDFENMSWSAVAIWVAEQCMKENNSRAQSRAGGLLARAKHLVANEFFPHIGLEAGPRTLRLKQALFASLVCRTCRVALFELAPDPRDHFGRMMVEQPGILIARLLRVYLRRTTQECLRIARSRIDASRHFRAADLFRRSNVTNSMVFALSTGSWGTEKAGSAIKGVAQLFKRMNLQASLSQLRCMRKPGEIMDPAPRQLDVHEWGIACPSETPEGENCGLLKHMAAHATVCNGRDTRTLLCTLLPYIQDHLLTIHDLYATSPGSPQSSAMLFVNCVPIGILPDGRMWATRFRALRRRQMLPFDTSIVYEESTHDLYVDAECGSVRRPLFVLCDLDPSTAATEQRRDCIRDRVRRIRELCAVHQATQPDLWRRLVDEGLVEFVSKREEDALRIRPSPSHDMGFEHRERIREWATPEDPAGEGNETFWRHYQDLPYTRNGEEVRGLLAQHADAAASEPGLFVEPQTRRESLVHRHEHDFDPGRVVKEMDAYHRALRSQWNQEPIESYLEEEMRHVQTLDKDTAKSLVPILQEVRSRTPEWQRAFRAFVATHGDRLAFRTALKRKTIPKVLRDSPKMTQRSITAFRRATWASLLELPCLARDEEVARRYWIHLERVRARDLTKQGLLEEGVAGFSSGRAFSYRDDRWDFTHSEIHATAIHGLVTSLIVFSNHNQAPRNTFQAAIGKAALCEPQECGLNHSHERMPGTQVPIVQTLGERMLNPRHTRSGLNCVVAILCHKGENQEDSLYMCLDDFQRGMFRTCHNQTYVDTARVSHRCDTQQFEVPDEHVYGKRDVNYDKLGEDGHVEPGTLVEPRDVLIGKTVQVDTVVARKNSATNTIATSKTGPSTPRDPPSTSQTPEQVHDGGLSMILTAEKSQTSSKEEVPARSEPKRVMTLRRDQSTVLRDSEPPGTVGAVLRTEGNRGRDILKVSIQRIAQPMEGDKFSSRHGQKGTIGKTLTRAEMPWGVMHVPIRDSSGKVIRTQTTPVFPNILVNTHSQPSRMTAGMLMEMMAGLCGTMGGYIFDGTSFDTRHTPGAFEDEMRRLGLPKAGCSTLYHGETGEVLGNANVFVGICFYQRLKQRVLDKARALDKGTSSALTRQPMEGKYGGLRLGEMERDALVAHGSTAVVQDAFLIRSDDTIVYACAKCQLLANPPRIPEERLRHLEILHERVGWCNACRTSDHVVRFRAPYAFKLFQQELMALGVAIRIRVQASGEIDFANVAAAGVCHDPSKLPRIRDRDIEVLWREREEEEEDEDEDINDHHHDRLGVNDSISIPLNRQGRSRAMNGVNDLPGGWRMRGPDPADGLLIQEDLDYGL